MPKLYISKSDGGHLTPVGNDIFLNIDTFKRLDPRQVPPGRLLADTNASFMIEEPTIHTLVAQRNKKI
jgi:hypothetical protein